MSSWLYAWMDEYEVRSPEHAARLHGDGNAHRRLMELAGAASEHRYDDIRTNVPGRIIAGRSLDLSDVAACAHADCLIRQVESLFGQFWHYFDSVVVEGPSAASYLRGNDDAWRLAQHVKLLTYLRDTGATKYLEFREKPHAFCQHHFEEAAHEGGLERLLDPTFRERVVSQIISSGTLQTAPGGGEHFFQYRGSDVGFSVRGRDRPIVRLLARQIYASNALALIGDVSLSRSMQSPLVQSAAVYHRIDIAGPAAEQTLLDIHLPVVEGLPLVELLALRESYEEELLQFRGALSRAVRERATSGEAISDIPNSVLSEEVLPLLGEIDTKLKSAQRSLSINAGLAIGVGAVVATVGLMASAPLVIAAGLAAMGTSMKDTREYVAATNEVALSDVHFLWRVRRAANAASIDQRRKAKRRGGRITS